jgi:hypothetical protein
MFKYMLLFPLSVSAGPYIEVGLGVPLTPDTGYIPDQYGIAGFGYVHHIDHVASIDIGFEHRSLTGTDANACPHTNCNGDNAIAAKLRFEWK